MADMSFKNLEYMIHHVFLPPKLPGEGQDHHRNAKDHALIARLSSALVEFAEYSDGSEAPIVMPVSNAIESLTTLIDPDGPAMEDALRSMLPRLCLVGQVLPIYVAQQNAGVVVRRTSNEVVFETLELVPPNGVVMAAQGRLKRVFPGDAVAVDNHTFADAAFIQVMSQTLGKMSMQRAPGMLGKAKKAGAQQVEDRETTNPALVTKLLTGYLRGVGHAYTPPCLWKNTRDEVMWSQARLSWHRSPVWLLARVAMQMAFMHTAADTSNVLYKEAMIFFMSRVLLDATQTRDRPISSDFLHCMVAKITRRMKKLADTHGHRRLCARKWYPIVTSALAKAESELAQRWTTIQQVYDPGVAMSGLASLRCNDDTPAELADLDMYLHGVLRPHKAASSAQFQPPPMVGRLPADTLPTDLVPADLSSKNSSHRLHCLAAFESWVEHHLAAWLHVHQHETSTCGRLETLLYSYHTNVPLHYGGDSPESKSLMVLTCLELWVACDQSATAIHPLLLEYNPGIPIGICQSLLLPLKSQLERLSRIEAYVGGRVRQATASHPNILSGFGKPNTFAVQYFQSSEAHKQLMNKIVQEAATEKAEKLAEYDAMKNAYSDLMKEFGRSKCTYDEDEDGDQRHAPRCRKCECNRAAECLNITVFEWPLPQNTHEAQATVVEISRPPAFGAWRDATMYLLMDIFRLEYAASKVPAVRYEPHSCLMSYETTSPQRVRLLSQTKPATITHRSISHITVASRGTVCVTNGLQYRYYDKKGDCFVDRHRDTGTLSSACVYTMPAVSAGLQMFLHRPHTLPSGPEPNVAISAQSSCPASMSLEEFKALAAIPYGTRTQWSNILVQLAVPSIDFKKIETYLVILQTIYQAGPPSSLVGMEAAREGHQDLQEPAFRRKLLDCLANALQRIRENWESYQSLAAFIAIANRLATVAADGDDDGNGITEHCRAIAMQWMLVLRDRAREATDADVRRDSLKRVFELALIGTTTFHADDARLTRTLENPDAAQSLLRFFISIDETFHTGYDINDRIIEMGYQRWTRLASRALPILLRVIIGQRSTCLSDAVRHVWADYREATPWRSCPGAEHWLASQSHARTSAGASSNLDVHFNLLTGELLVNGSPLSRLPAHFESQTVYGQLFGNTTIEVMPTLWPGMSFSSIQQFKGHQVYFGTDNSEDMKLTCTANDSTWDLIPRRVLRDRVPHHFLVDYTHWYHRKTSTVEFRPLKEPWVPQPSSWVLHRLLPTGRAPSRWKMMQGQAYLIIDRASRTSREMARVFFPVEEIAHVHLILDYKIGVLEVKLPRLKIQFHMPCQTPRLCSREFRGMYLDENTQIGTLVGLTSKLVLRDDTGRRAVLLPGGGDVTWTDEKGHSKVRAVLGTCNKVHRYLIDDQLGRLVDNGSVHSKLYLCFLHALTSYCVPDRLTSLTGTERALAILSESDIPSAARLTQENVDMLHKIAGLAPRRKFYPEALRDMQDVTWDNELSFLSQHAELYVRSQALLDDAARREFFHQDKDALVGLNLRTSEIAINTDLLRRDANRTSTFYRAGFGGELFTTQGDGSYTGRAAGSERLDERQHAAYFATSGVVRGRGTLQHQHDPDLTSTLLRLLKSDNVLGLGSTLEAPIVYDADYLEEPIQKLAPIWWLLHQLLQNNAPNKFAFAMFTATLAFSDRIPPQVVDALCVMYTNNAAKRVVLPRASSFSMGQGHEALSSTITSHIQSHAWPYASSDESRLSRLGGESKQQSRKRKEYMFVSRRNEAAAEFTEEIEKQWPCAQLQSPESTFINQYFFTDRAMVALNRQFQSWWDNKLFYKYLEDLSQAIAAIPQHALWPPVFDSLVPAEAQPRLRAYTTTSDLFTLAPPAEQDLSRPAQALADAVEQDMHMQTANPALPVLDALCGRLAGMADQQFKKAYVADLRKSIDCIQDGRLDTETPSVAGDKYYYRRLLAAATARRDALYEMLQRAATSSLPAYQQYSAPRPSPLLYLAQLSHTAWPHLALGWQKAITAFGCAVADVQRASRLVAVCHNAVDLARELANTGHDNWNPLDSPEILLQEVMGGILARKIQIDIARTMAGPPGAQNAVMQLNMGEGKSSVIAPIVAASLADGTRLAMVIVGKPQSKQMLQMLVSKLGGLSGRRIYHMPFSRSLVLDEEHYDAIHKMCQECRDAGGIMLVQPEHLLSFQLCGPELAIAGQEQLSALALKTQTFFNDYARCIVDESDENFSVKFELIYTMGTQSSVELSPDRWVLIQAVLGIVQDVAPLVRKELPLSISIEREAVAGSFPRIRFLRDDGRVRVCQLIAETVCQNGIQGLPIGRQSPAVREAIKRYITEAHPNRNTVETVETCQSFWTETVKPRLYLLRGLLGRSVLGFTFGSKRWRVNYGVDDGHRPPTRLAVPFRAKDRPALQSEFSHPDVVIVLTCLSYYYSGLSSDDLFASLQNLALSGQASAKYDDWVRGASLGLPNAFRSLGGINVKDRHQCEEQVFPHLKRSKGAIDYFLSSMVFPKEMKEFPQKLSASGWDIGKQKVHPTTGFSGTSDSQHLLPLSVKHLDLPGQRHTNALVLYHLVQPKNTVVYMPTEGQPWTSPGPSIAATVTPAEPSGADRLLRLIVNAKPAIQVILDAGAQILELTNVEMAKQWLRLDKSNKDAVVYCGDNDDVMIVDKSGHIEAFETSPFAQQLDRCLVFLDEAHTRGIDLKLPPLYRAAVTLGANLTKDRLVQACMRMRQLGQGQSVVFYVTKEIQDKIAAIKGVLRVDEKTCTVSDILAWAISETWADLSRSMPLWAVQGTRYAKQKHIWDEAHGHKRLTRACANKFLEDEAMSLAEHYMPKATIKTEMANQTSATEYLDAVFGATKGVMARRDPLPELNRIVERCRQFDAHQHAGTSALHEEQERELAPEIESEKHVERPHQLEPLKHSLHPEIKRFVQTGSLPDRHMQPSQAASLIAQGNIGFVPAFWSLASTSAAKHLAVGQFPQRGCLHVSTDFARTVNMPCGGTVSHSDAYLRPVQWVLTRRNNEQGTIAAMVLISPYEAQRLIPDIKKAQSRVFLSLYAPRSSQDVAPIDHLQLYTVPRPTTTTPEFSHDATSSFSVQLNLFAGQLYFSSKAEYRSACKYLGLAAEASTDSRTVVGADGFIVAGEDKSRNFTTSPAAFLGVYLAKIRWNCDTIDKTHWGKILGGQFLVDSDFE